LEVINFLESEYLSKEAREYFATQDYESPEFQERYQAIMYRGGEGLVPPINEFEKELIRAQRIHVAAYWLHPSTTVQ
jgi:hypothetical protein